MRSLSAGGKRVSVALIFLLMLGLLSGLYTVLESQNLEGPMSIIHGSRDSAS